MRGKKAKVRIMQPDIKYGSDLVTKFIKKIMLDGKKNLAQKMFYEVIEGGAKELNIEPMDFVNKTVDNLRPALEVKSRRVGGANYSIPMPVSPARQESLAIRWIVEAARLKSGDSFTNILRKEMIDVYNGQGSAYEKKLNVERMAEANKAFAHFKW